MTDFLFSENCHRRWKTVAFSWIRELQIFAFVNPVIFTIYSFDRKIVVLHVVKVLWKNWFSLLLMVFIKITIITCKICFFSHWKYKCGYLWQLLNKVWRKMHLYSLPFSSIELNLAELKINLAELKAHIVQQNSERDPGDTAISYVTCYSSITTFCRKRWTAY